MEERRIWVSCMSTIELEDIINVTVTVTEYRPTVTNFFCFKAAEI